MNCIDNETKIVQLAQECLIHGPATCSQITQYINSYRGIKTTTREVGLRLWIHRDIFKIINRAKRGGAWKLRDEPFIIIRSGMDE